MLDSRAEEPIAGGAPPPSGTPVDEGTAPVERCWQIPLEKRALPRDVDELQDTVIQLATTLIEKQELIDKQRLELERLRRKVFGRSSEKLERQPAGKPETPSGEDSASPAPEGSTTDPSTTERPADPPETSPPAPTPEPAEAGPNEPTPDRPDPDRRRKGHGRQSAPKNLRREEEVLDLPEEDRFCEVCGLPLKECGRIESSYIEHVPASLVLRVRIRVKRVCEDPTCPQAPVTPELSPLPIDKGRAGPGLLAYTVVSKFADHLPLYRLKKILSREGFTVPESTLGGWCTQVAGLLLILYELMVAEVLESKVIHTDDTPVQVLGAKKGESKQGHIWIYLGDKDHRFVVFDFTPHRRGEAPQAFLRSFRGYLQADAFAGYNALYKSGRVVEVACWAHARRGVEESLGTNPVVVVQILAKIQKLYAVEDEAKDLEPEARKALRIEKSKPVIDELFRWFEDHDDRILPNSELGKAIGYFRNQREALERYLENGDLRIDNNPAENILRTVAIGRRNWLFLGSPRGGHTAAVLYSIVESARLHAHNPLAYLTDVLSRIRTTPRDNLRDLLPDRWKPSSAPDVASAKAS